MALAISLHISLRVVERGIGRRGRGGDQGERMAKGQ